MKTYWKVIYGCAALMLVLLALPFAWWWAAGGIAACLLAGYAGVKLVPYVPALRGKHVSLAVGCIILGGVLQGAGLFLQVCPVWALGLMMTLAIPLAGLACDSQADDELRRQMLEQLA
jgi:hypothetical protein